MMFENLETRRMFSVGTPVVTNGVLTIVGDAANDQVEVSKLNAQQIVVNDFTTSQSFTFIASAVTSIRFEGGAGNDSFTVIEGTGSRRLNLPVVALGGAGNDVLTSTGGNDRLEGEAGADDLNAGNGNDVLLGGTGSDELIAGAGDDQLDGGTGADQMNGGEGIDTVDYSARTARVTVNLRSQGLLGRSPTRHGEALESDTIVGMENVNGGAGSDILTGSSIVNRIFGNGGNDKIKGLGGDDRLEGGAGADQISGAEGRDDLRGNAGADMLIGGSDNDSLDGGTENDILIGGSGRDVMNGGAGDDFLFAQDAGTDPSGGDLVTGGAGSDTAELDANDPVQTVEELLT